MGKKRDLRKRMTKRGLEVTPAVVICTGKHCCPRSESRALIEETRNHLDAVSSPVKLVTVGCLGICKKGPIAASYPVIKFSKRATPKRVHKLIDTAGR